MLLGQNSLPVFCSGIFFGFIARLGLEADDGAAMQLAVNLLAPLAMLAVGGLGGLVSQQGTRAGRPPTGHLAGSRSD